MNKIAKTVQICILLCCAVLTGCGGTAVVVTDEYPIPLLEKYPYSAGVVIPPEFANYIYEESRDDRGMKSVDLGAAQAAILGNVLGGMFTTLEQYESRPESINVDVMFEPRLEDFQYALPAETSVEVLEVWAKYSIRISDSAGREITDWAVTAYGKSDQRFMSSRGSIFGEAVRVAVRDLGANIILGLPRDIGFKSWLDDQGAELSP
ncbi:MAG: hypothetical protein HOJ88_00045 [Proteobacteria bacterium]|jgi:hypothetical protein|nr:hypothetical protein [Pseudomonadota bacterium]